ncbi:carboxypeptidase-like regulatory domain-containing protein [Dyadobacter sp. CY323]|uniref:carboxypeptidase-like regulatory domain-containing protein n=1 Tax=Dyadobacter sp. CY323 TaxID=2907302 RepID=UPI001F411505|nr:carboxypeptidase-like regulatory domain-containing protein [Dyadobacter sp. CY323]
MITNLTDCFWKQDRTTTVYGTITDQNGQPVDSILVLVQGLRSLTFETLKEVYTDNRGEYELLVEVPKRFHAVNVGIPNFPQENPKFLRMYKDYKLWKNDQATNNCCTAIIGKKTKYDFQLIPR